MSFDAILGPVSYSLYLYNGRRIHLFGDYHKKLEDLFIPRNSITIQNLFVTIAERAAAEKKQVHTYFEACYRTNIEEKEKYPMTTKDCYLSETTAAFASSLTINKEESKYYPYSKYHYCDIRCGVNVKDNSSVPFGFLHHVGKLIFLCKEAMRRGHILIVNKISGILSSIVEELKPRPHLLFDIIADKNNGKVIFEVLKKRVGFGEVVHDLFKTGTNTHKIRHHLLNIDSELSTKIRDFFREKYSVSMSLLLEVLSQERNLETMNKASDILEDIEVIFFDMYVLARMFRSMKWDPECKEYICYIGEAHKKNYDEFFETINLELLLNINQTPELPSLDTSVLLNLGIEPRQRLESEKFREIFGENLFK